jgi:hypothetical protein
VAFEVAAIGNANDDVVEILILNVLDEAMEIDECPSFVQVPF